MVPKVKICGVTRLEDAQLATELGAWALGMIFYEPSPRRCAREEAVRIAAALRRRVELCGVFVNAPINEVVRAADEIGLTLLQLHGDEGPAYCAEVGHRTGARVIKAVQIASVGDVRDVERYHVDYHLLDTRPSAPERARLRGGTGETFDWSLLRVRRSRVPLILSGGLAPENVGAALEAIAQLGPRAQPFALDTASGTEAAPGRKDPARLRAFFDAVGAAGVSGGVGTAADGSGDPTDSDPTDSDVTGDAVGTGAATSVSVGTNPAASSSADTDSVAADSAVAAPTGTGSAVAAPTGTDSAVAASTGTGSAVAASTGTGSAVAASTGTGSAVAGSAVAGSADTDAATTGAAA